LIFVNWKEQESLILELSDDAGAKQVATDLLSSIGWNTIDVGDITGSRLLEPLCILWVQYGFRTGTWNHAFALLRK
jgi:predicted dinucleotide-binding enzyme